MLAVYVSGHGFGHSVRTAEVLRTLRLMRPALGLAIVTEAPEALFREAIGGDFTYRNLGLDVGLAQQGALGIDLEGTLVRLEEKEARLEATVDTEVQWLARVGARAVLADIPAAAFEIAAEARIPGIGLANFSWDWVYSHMASGDQEFARPAALARERAGKATLLLELPFAGDLSAFPLRERIGLVARVVRRGREEAREILGLPRGRLTVLVSFGGLGLDALSLTVLESTRDAVFLVERAGRGSGRNVRQFEPSDLRARGASYLDLVRAADVIVTKPGYGIVTDALACGTRIVYTERGDFPEYPILVGQMQELIPCEHVSNADLLSGRLATVIARVMKRPVPPPPPLDGATEAARRIGDILDGKGSR